MGLQQGRPGRLKDSDRKLIESDLSGNGYSSVFPQVSRDLRKQPADSPRRHPASRSAPPRPAHQGVGRSESGAKPAHSMSHSLCEL